MISMIGRLLLQWKIRLPKEMAAVVVVDDDDDDDDDDGKAHFRAVKAPGEGSWQHSRPTDLQPLLPKTTTRVTKNGIPAQILKEMQWMKWRRWKIFF
jgi:hypothetical protein